MEKCEICGTTKNITKHHIKKEGNLFKIGGRYVVIPLCKDCHSTYERIKNVEKSIIKRYNKLRKYVPEKTGK